MSRPGTVGATPKGAGSTSIQSVAERAGVSIATVSRVINGNTSKVSKQTSERVLGVISELGYRPSAVGSALRSGRSRLVALMFPEPQSAVFAAIVDSIGRALQAQGKLPILCNTRDDPHIQDDLISEMQSQLVSGIIMVGAVKSKALSSYLARRDPIVLVGRQLKGLKKGLFVGIDNEKGGRDVGEVFLSKGFRSVWIFHGPFTSRSTELRTKGFLDALGDRQGEIEVKSFKLADSRMSSAYELALREISVQGRPQAIFCTADEIAFGIYKHCRDIGLSVPQDLYLFGFDGSPLNAYLAPWLNTVRIPYHTYGPAVAEALDHQWKHGSPSPADFILPHELVWSGADGAA